MRYVTLFGHDLELAPSPELAAFHTRLAAAGPAAEDLLYGDENPLASSARLTLADRPVWTADTLRSPEWAYLADAVARARVSTGTLDAAAVESRATWTAEDAAASLGVSEQAVRSAVSSGSLPGVMVRGQLRLDPSAVEAHVTTRATGRTTRVPALYARTGHQGDAYLAVHGGRPTLVSSRDGLDTQVWPEWTEVIVTWSDGREDRAARLQPAHSRRTEVISQGVLEVRGRWTVVEWANTPATVGAMLVAAAPPD